MKDVCVTDAGLLPKEYGSNPITHVRIVIDMDMHESDFLDLDYNLVEAYRKFSEITKGNITGGKVEEI